MSLSRCLKYGVVITALTALATLAGCPSQGGDQSSASPAGPSTSSAPAPAPPAPSAPGTGQTPGAAQPTATPEEQHTLYLQFCSACHGPDAKGLPKLGKDLTTSQFIKEETDDELLKYVQEGRPVDDPRNTTGVAMPPRGGNPALKDDQIRIIIQYLRSLQQESAD